MRQGRVQGKVVVVTGAAQGIGLACARRLASEGARVILSDVKAAEGAMAAHVIVSKGQQAAFLLADVTEENDCSALMEFAAQTFGRIDGLLNNAGWYPRATLEETTTEFWEQVQHVNLRGAFYCCKFALPYLRAAGGGSIVNMGSRNGIQGRPALLAYSAAKGGLLTMSQTLAGALAPDRIRVNYLNPGWVLTEAEIALHGRNGISEAELARKGAALALGRHQSVEDAASAALYLLSDEAAQVTGTVFHVDAGSTLPIQPGAPYK